MPNFSYSPSTNIYTVGSAISSLSPTTVTGGGTVPATTFSTVSTFVPTSFNLNGPRGITSDGSGNLYEADFGGNAIYKISSTGVPTLIAGGTSGFANSTTGTSAKFKNPWGIVYDGAGSLYVTDNGNHRIRKISTTAPYAVTTIAGNGTGAEVDNTTGTNAQFNSPSGIDYDGSGFLYVCDFAGNKIRKISTAGINPVTTIAGTGAAAETDNTTGTLAKLNGPAGIVYDGSGFLFVSDAIGNKIRKISTAGAFPVTTFAGTGTAGSADGTGTTVATFSAPYGITMDASGNLIVADNATNLIRKISPAAIVTTLAGTGASAELDAVGTLAKFVNPYGITADNSGNVFVGDNNAASSNIRKILLTGYTISPALPATLNFDVTTGIITGTPGVPFSATTFTITGYNASGSFSTAVTLSAILLPPAISYAPSTNSYVVNTAISTLSPMNTGGAIGTMSYGTGTVIASGIGGADAMAIDASGNIYVTAYDVGKILKYSASGTFIGTFGTGVTMSLPSSLVFDSSGNCFVLDKGNKCVYEFNASGAYQSTIISSLNQAYGIAIDASNFIYLADYGANTVKKYNTSGTLQSLSVSTTNLSNPSGVAVDQSGNIYVANYTSGKVGKYNSTGTLITANFITGLSGPWTIAIDGAGNVFVGDSGNGIVKVYNSAGTLLTSISGFSACDGLVPDAAGNLYVSDYGSTMENFKKFTPVGGYFISDVLPAGLSFDNTTGNFTGTPTASFGPATYTVTAYNASGVGSTNVTLLAGKQIAWAGNASAVWGTAGNWSGGVAPGPSDQALIGSSTGFVTTPVVSANTNVGAIIMGTLNGSAPAISVSSGITLAVAGDITYKADAQSYRNVFSSFTGSGNITAFNLNVSSTYVASPFPYIFLINSSINSLKLNGNLALTSNFATIGGTPYTFNSTFNVTGGTTTVAGIVQTTNTAGSTSTISVTNGTLQLANAAALSGLSSLGTNSISFNNTGSTVEYSGANAQMVYTDASITGLSLGVSYQNLKFSGGGIKTLLSGNLNIAGDFTNTLANDVSNYADLKTATVIFNGTTQNLAGGSANGTTYYNVNFSGSGTKSMASGNFSVASTGILKMVGSTATLDAGGILTLKSDASSSAAVDVIPSGSLITGLVNVERYISGGALKYRGYRFLSSPVYTTKAGSNYYFDLSYLSAYAPITGSLGTGGGMSKSGNPTIYLYRDNISFTNGSYNGGNFRGVNKINNSTLYSIGVDGDGNHDLHVGTGFWFFYRGNTTNIATKYLLNTIPEANVFVSKGTLNQQAVAVINWYTGLSTLQCTPIPGNTGYGYNLVGNPYASSIDWNTFSTTDPSAGIYGPQVNKTIYIYNESTKIYGTYDGTLGINGASRVIPSGQGFYVKAIDATATLVFNEAAKTSAQVAGPTQATGSTLLLSTKPVANNTLRYMRLDFAKDTDNVEETIVRFDGTAKNEYVLDEDSRYMSGSGAVSFSSISSDNVSLAINRLPLPKNKQTVIKLNINATADGLYTINKTELKSVPELYEIWLMDAYKKDSLDIKHNSTYKFDVLKNDTNSYGSNRFSLVMRQNPALALHLLNFTGSKETSGAQIVWKTENEANYTNFTVERSTDNGKTFDVLGGFASNGQAIYNLTDKNPLVTTDCYRLKLEDLNSTITYSKVVALMYSKLSNTIASSNVNIYPNPTRGNINVSINPSTLSFANTSDYSFNIVITGSNGTIVKKAISSQLEWQDNVASLLPGSYVVQIVNNKDKSVVGKTKFVKL